MSEAHGRAIVTDITEQTIIDPLLTTYILSAPWTQKHEAQLWINNPFTDTVTVHIAQPLPSGIILLDAGGASQIGNTLTWDTVVSPTSLSKVTFTFSFPAIPNVANTLPPASINLVNPLDGQLLESSSNSVDFQALWPLTLDYTTPGHVLPGNSSTIAISVTNWLSNSAINGMLTVHVTDVLSNTVYTESKPFDVAANATGIVNFTFPPTQTSGNYVVHGRVDLNGASMEAFADFLHIGILDLRKVHVPLLRR
jgi:hypothetical protein